MGKAVSFEECTGRDSLVVSEVQGLDVSRGVGGNTVTVAGPVLDMLELEVVELE